MSTGLGIGTLPPTPAQALGLILSVDKNTLPAVAGAVQGSANQPAGIALLTAQSQSQVQMAVGVRPLQSSFSPFRY